MPRLPGISQRTAQRVLAKVGFEVIRQGKHMIMSDGVRIVQIPRHNPINSFTMGKIAQDAGLTPQEFKELM
jgi:predicted RNA binding protein YcfA (HicA-like mRNA interferase family)